MATVKARLEELEARSPSNRLKPCVVKLMAHYDPEAQEARTDNDATSAVTRIVMVPLAPLK